MFNLRGGNTPQFHMWFKYGLKAQKLLTQGSALNSRDLQKQHALKGQKLLAQGSALGIKTIGKAPCKGKSFKIYLIKFENPLRYVKLLPFQAVLEPQAKLE